MNLVELKNEMHNDYKKAYVEEVALVIEQDFNAKIVKAHVGFDRDDFSSSYITIKYLGHEIPLDFSNSGKSLYVGKRTSSQFEFKAEVLDVLFKKLQKLIAKGGLK